MTSLVYKNFSNGYVIEIVPDGVQPCSPLLPAENLWNSGVRIFLYSIAMIYIFLGIAIASDVFMCAIEVITSRRRTVVRWDEEKQTKVEKEVLVWNETVANLTLMALGSSAPEIILAVYGTAKDLGRPASGDGLGTFTIIGSAAFNLLIITAICIISVPSPEVKRVKELGVFIMTSAWSIFAYIWMLIVLQWISPGVIQPWEAWLTLAFFPTLVLIAYCQDNNWWCDRCHKKTSVEAMQSQTNVRVITDRRRVSMVQGLSKELGALEKEKHKSSMANLKAAEEGKLKDTSSLVVDHPSSRRESVVSTASHDSSPSRLGRHRSSTPSEEGSLTKLVPTSRPSSAVATGNKNVARARFRHAAVRSILGGKKRPMPQAQNHKPNLAEVVTSLPKGLSPEDMLGKFTFASPSYSVLESAGIITVDIFFHRALPGSAPKMNGVNGNAPGLAPVEHDKETSFINKVPEDTGNKHYGTVAVEYETREGSGKIDKDFKYTSGKLTFAEDECKKSISVPIINDNQYEADVDFYIILKNSEGDSGIADPSICRVTIIDDDEPGEFQFSEPHYYADLNSASVNMEITRQKGCDGTVTIEYTTVDGTARGGDSPGSGCDYKRSEGVITFLHNESSKIISIDVDKNASDSKNFIITLKNPSLGAKIGEHGAAVAYMTKDVLNERIADLLADDDEEEVTYCGQFKNAMTLSDDDPENPLKWYDYLLHFLSFFWKIVFAFVPPRQYLGAWPSFILSLALIGGLTAFVDHLGTVLGCVAGIKPSVAGITIIALGTSLPDTFASRTAALHDSGADAAIGNITGSNSVNVFLGLGLPWVISSMYAWANNQVFRVPTDNLVQSVVVFTICGTICIFLLILRRKFFGGELGGHAVSKYLSSAFLTLLWIIYIVMSSLQAYYPDIFPW